jgi:hypothetical protein
MYAIVISASFDVMALDKLLVISEYASERFRICLAIGIEKLFPP